MGSVNRRDQCHWVQGELGWAAGQPNSATKKASSTYAEPYGQTQGWQCHLKSKVKWTREDAGGAVQFH